MSTSFGRSRPSRSSPVRGRGTRGRDVLVQALSNEREEEEEVEEEEEEASPLPMPMEEEESDGNDGDYEGEELEVLDDDDKDENYEEEDEDDEEEEDDWETEEFRPKLTRSPRKKKTSRQQRATSRAGVGSRRRRAVQNVDEDEDAEPSDDDEEETPRRRASPLARKATAAAAKGPSRRRVTRRVTRRTSPDPSDDDEDDYEEESGEDDEIPAASPSWATPAHRRRMATRGSPAAADDRVGVARRSTPRRACAAQADARIHSLAEESLANYENDYEGGEEEGADGAAARRLPLAANEDGSEEGWSSDYNGSGSGPRSKNRGGKSGAGTSRRSSKSTRSRVKGPPRRRAGKDADERKGEVCLFDEDDDEEGKDLPRKKRKTMGTQPSRRRCDDDDEYVVDSEEDLSSDASLDDDDVELMEQALVEDTGNVDGDDENFLSDDASSADGGKNAAPRKRASSRTTPLKIRRTPGRNGRSREAEGDDEDSSADEAGLDRFPTTAVTFSSPRRPRLPPCPSEKDEVTLERLPSPHVCYIAPDGRTRHCFSLDTLYRIALKTGSPKRADDGKIAFLQPPHFRTAMEDDLLDQIASRFGRAALTIEDSSVYKKELGMDGVIRSEFGNVTNFDLGDEDDIMSANFDDRFGEYMQRQMGSADIYCCPVCYVEAERRYRGEDADVDDDSTAEDSDGTGTADPFVFDNDPMTVLGSLDGDEFEVASGFCFRRVAEVKGHLRDVHKADTSIVSGNDLYRRFQIRVSDGLLQRWLKKVYRRDAVQGDMRRYWYEGHNQSFIYLMHNIEHNRLIDEARGERQEGTPVSNGFCTSFQHRSKKYWTHLSTPYEKYGNDVDDFIVDENEEEEEEGLKETLKPATEDNKHTSGIDFGPEEQMIKELRRRRMGREGICLDSSSDGNSADEKARGGKYHSDEESTSDKTEYYSEEEEKDPWVERKRAKSKLGRKSRKGDSKEEGSPQSMRAVATPNTGAGPSVRFSTSSKGSGRRRIIESDEDD